MQEVRKKICLKRLLLKRKLIKLKIKTKIMDKIEFPSEYSGEDFREWRQNVEFYEKHKTPN